MIRTTKKKVKKTINPVGRTITFGLSEFDELLKQVRLETTQKTGILYLVKLAEMGFTEEQIIDVFESISKYVTYLDNHIVQIKEVEDIIFKHTGIKIEF